VIARLAGLGHAVLPQLGAAFLNAVKKASAMSKTRNANVRMVTLEPIAPSRSRPAPTTATSKVSACMVSACVEQDGVVRTADGGTLLLGVWRL